MSNRISKLKRNNVIEAQNGDGVHTLHILSDEEYEKELFIKLQEETNHLCSSNGRKHIIDGIADVMEIFDAIEKHYDIDYAEVLARKMHKAQTEGSYNNKVLVRNITEISEHGVVKFKYIGYNKLKYPEEYEVEMREIAGHLDKTFIEDVEKYSLHTEYSYGQRNLDSPLLEKYPTLKNSHKRNVPELWKSKQWAEEFAMFILDLTKDKNAPTTIEIHPPFKDYCTLDEFIDRYSIFERIIHDVYKDVAIVIENRAGTIYSGKQFLISTTDEIVSLCKRIKEDNLKLGVVFDVPQLITAEELDAENFNIEKYLSCTNRIKEHRDVIKGIHIWGKKRGKSGRWVSHSGTLDTYFNYNEEYKRVFLEGIRNICDDGIERCLVPEVNSGSGDLEEMLRDLLNYLYDNTMLVRK